MSKLKFKAGGKEYIAGGDIVAMARKSVADVATLDKTPEIAKRVLDGSFDKTSAFKIAVNGILNERLRIAEFIDRKMQEVNSWSDPVLAETIFNQIKREIRGD